MKNRIMLTGAATLLGAEVLNDLLRRDHVELILLISGDEELVRLQSYLGPLPAGVLCLQADLSLPQFGLSPGEWNELATSVHIGFHCAQREARDQDLELARQHNVRPIESWIELLGRTPHLRMNHMSTAFVGGTRRGLFTEFDLNCGQGFNDAWEQSKFEAEARLRESHVNERVTIYRPSHVLGRAATGEAFELGGAYPLLATLAGASVLPGDARARLDFVPVDYVAAAVVAIALSRSPGTFHLACGWEKSIELETAVELDALCKNRRNGSRSLRGSSFPQGFLLSRAVLLPRAVAYPLRLAGCKTMGNLVSRREAFAIAHHQLHQSPVFDTYLADLTLSPMGIHCPRATHWLETSVRKAQQQGWRS
jgi:thioester reductase-like protein